MTFLAAIEAGFVEEFCWVGITRGAISGNMASNSTSEAALFGINTFVCDILIAMIRTSLFLDLG
jgi:hypothetical protein